MEKLPYRIATYNGNNVNSENVVYVLNKGLNSGKPSFTPFRNSFAVICDTANTTNKIYITLYILQHCRAFDLHLIGSVIPFIRLRDFKTVLQEHEKLLTDEILQNEINTIFNLLSKYNNLVKQCELIKEMIKCHSRRVSKKAKI